MKTINSKTNLIITKLLICLLAAFLSLFVCAIPAFACTGVYIGSQVSEDGTTMIARSNDTTPTIKPAFVKIFGGSDGICPSEIISSNGFNCSLPKTLFRTLVTPSSKSTDVISSKAAINECGVSCSATVTGYCSDESLKYNDFVKDGLNEGSIPLLVGVSCATAREGIELLAKTIDEKGSAEDNILMISDQDEAWYMEIYGGHQYCAVKAPEDCVALIGNEFMIETIDENSNDVIFSKDLFNLPKEKGFALYSDDGKMNIFNTYVGKDNFKDTAHMRTWRGHQILSPSTIGSYSATTKYPLFYKPDKKISVEDVMDIYRDRYDGTEFDINVNGKYSYWSISEEFSQTTQILQTFKDVPKNFALVDWIAFSNAENNVFVPFSNFQSKFEDAYTYSATDYYNVDEKACYTAFKQLNVLGAQNREKLGNGIRSYWNIIEKYSNYSVHQLMDKLKNSSNAQAEINEFYPALQNQLYYDALRMFEETNWHLMSIEKTYTSKSGLSKILNYVPYVDVALLANIFGWKIEDNKLQNHSPEHSEFDGKITRDPNQNDTDDTEGYIKFSKDNNTIEVHTNNGRRNSSGYISVNGESKKFDAKLYDGKIYATLPIIDVVQNLNNDEGPSLINAKIISANNSLNNSIFNQFINVPLWIVVLIVLLILVAVVIYFIYARKKKSK